MLGVCLCLCLCVFYIYVSLCLCWVAVCWSSMSVHVHVPACVRAGVESVYLCVRARAYLCVRLRVDLGCVSAREIRAELSRWVSGPGVTGPGRVGGRSGQPSVLVRTSSGPGVKLRLMRD